MLLAYDAAVAGSLVAFVLEGEALPADVRVASFDAQEALSEPYSVTIELTTADRAFRVDACLRKRLLFQILGEEGPRRIWDGVVNEARFLRMVSGTAHFAVRLSPAIAALAHREGCRIFQDFTIVEIVALILREAGIERVEWRLAKEYEKREFVVQYRETHLSFVSRLLEEEGIFYFFRHELDGHTLIFADDSSAFAPEEGKEPVSFALGAGLDHKETIAHFSRTRSLRTSTVHLRDYDFKKPAVPPEAVVSAKEAWSLPHFEYPAGFLAGGDAGRKANARMRSLRADADICRGESHAAALCPGFPFTVEGAAEACLDGTFVVTHLHSTGRMVQFGGGGNANVENSFRAIPEKAPYAPPRRTKKPRIRGVQTALVTGASAKAEAIHVDDLGRIKVRFSWDREGQKDDTSSAWIRVCQPMMGGTMILPRIGWEVAVAFLEGDPDRPVVLGRVYNAEKMPPLSLPGSKVTGTLRTHSSPGGAGYNEISMADGAGSQGLSVRAQKDLNVVVLHDKVETIGASESSHLQVNGSVSVGATSTVSVGAAQTLDVGSVRSQKIGGDQKITVAGNETSNATANVIESIGGDRTYLIGGRRIHVSNGVITTVEGDISKSVGSLLFVGSLGSVNDHVLGALSETVGAVKVVLAKGNAGEKTAGSLSMTHAAAEVHLTKGDLAQEASGSVTNLVGGLHYEKLGGSYVVKAPMITLLGAIGTFSGGGSSLKLGGGPVVLKGSTIRVTGGVLVKFGASMKLG